MSAHYDVVVAGLGTMGSAAAYHLARRGVRVLGLDRYVPPHAQGSSHGQTRIIREAYLEGSLYVPLVQRAYVLWAALEAESGRKLLQQTGGLMIGPPEGAVVSGALRSAREHGLPHRLLDAADIRAEFPALKPPPEMVAVAEPRAGVLFAEACVESHLALAKRHGATLRFGEPLKAWRAEGDGVRVTTARGVVLAGQLLVTAGPWLPSLMPELQLPMTIERQVLYWFDPLGDGAHFAPERCPIHIWESPAGSYFYGFPDFGQGVKLAVHHEGEATTPDAVRREVGAAEVAAMRSRMRTYLPMANGPLRSTAVCLYTNTPDEHFWIDHHPEHPQVLIASPCSGHGFKFASAIGDGLAQRLCGEAPTFDLGVFAAHGPLRGNRARA